MATKVLNYCGVVIGGSEDPENDLYRLSSIEANWNTGFQLWDDGDEKYVFWGDVNGEIQLFDLILAAASAAEVTKVVSNWTSATTIAVYQGLDPENDPYKVVEFSNMCYSMDVQSKRLRPFGDRYVIEGATRFQIWS